MAQKKARLLLLISGLFLLLDRLLKWQALHQWSENKLFGPHFGWQPFLNDGIAFSIHIPVFITIFFSIVIIMLISYTLYKEQIRNEDNIFLIFSLSILLGGALSNFFDRIWYAHVVDYFLLGTAVINISDIMIVAGLGIYILFNFKDKKV